MAFCGNCGGEVTASAAFCPKCGAAQATGTAAPTAPSEQPGSAVVKPANVQPGMSENVAGFLCYLVGWVTGIIFFLIDKRPFVKFHAAQSIVVFGGLQVLNILVGILFGAGFFFRGFGGFGIAAALYSLIGLVAFILWILLMVKAYQGEKYELPVAGDIAKSFAGKQI